MSNSLVFLANTTAAASPRLAVAQTFPVPARMLIGALMALLVTASTAVAGPFEEAKAAYEHDDYATALSLFRTLAGQGNADAQYNLGVMYENGQGAPQNYAEAVRWYQKAAGQGDAQAQHSLGLIYVNGQGVPQDY